MKRHCAQNLVHFSFSVAVTDLYRRGMLLFYDSTENSSNGQWMAFSWDRLTRTFQYFIFIYILVMFTIYFID